MKTWPKNLKAVKYDKLILFKLYNSFSFFRYIKH